MQSMKPRTLIPTVQLSTDWELRLSTCSLVISYVYYTCYYSNFIGNDRERRVSERTAERAEADK